MLAAFVDLDMTPPWWGAAAAREEKDVLRRLGAGANEDGASEDGVLGDETAEEERGQSGEQGQGAEGHGESEEEGGELSAWLQKQGIVHVVSSGRDAREGGREGGREGELGCESSEPRRKETAEGMAEGMRGQAGVQDAVVWLGAGAHFLPKEGGARGGRALLCARGHLDVVGVGGQAPGGGGGGGGDGRGKGGGEGGRQGGDECSACLPLVLLRNPEKSVASCICYRKAL